MNLSLSISPEYFPLYLLILVVVLQIVQILLTLRTRSSLKQRWAQKANGDQPMHTTLTTSKYETGVDEEPEKFPLGTDPDQQEEITWAMQEGGAESIEEALEYLREHKRKFGDR